MLSNLAFTGSSSVFEQMYKTVGNNISIYNNFPRIIGETGGMNFHFVFNDVVDIEDIALKTVRGAFEYSGQKCSATSRIYLPKSKADQIIGKLILETMKLKVDSPEKKGTFTSAVINRNSFEKNVKYIEDALDDPDNEIIVGGIIDLNWSIDNFFD